MAVAVVAGAALTMKQPEICRWTGDFWTYRRPGEKQSRWGQYFRAPRPSAALRSHASAQIL